MNISKLFRQNVESAGFTCEGIDSDLYVHKEDFTLRGVEFVYHILFYNTQTYLADGTPIIRVDYGKYLCGAENYLYTNIFD